MTAIRKYRKLAGMTQTELAQLLNVTPSAVTQWEAGTRKPNIIQLKRIAVILNCTTDDLLTTVT